MSREKDTDELRTCTVSDGNCEAPAAWRAGGNGGGVAAGDVATRSTCRNCGEPVCKNCSKVMTWRGKRRWRICNNCQQDGSR